MGCPTGALEGVEVMVDLNFTEEKGIGYGTYRFQGSWLVPYADWCGCTGDGYSLEPPTQPNLFFCFAV